MTNIADPTERSCKAGWMPIFFKTLEDEVTPVPTGQVAENADLDSSSPEISHKYFSSN